MNTITNETTETKKPVAKVRVGLITASIWENQTDNGSFQNVTFERRYKKGDQWHSTRSYGVSDLLELAKCADMAHTKILEATAKTE